MSADPVSAARIRRRTVLVLVASQVAGGVGVATGVTVGGLVAAELSGSDVVAGAAQTASVIGAAFAALGLSRVADRRGRRPALAAGYVLATLGALGCAGAVWRGSWGLLLAALIPFGAASAAGLSARFAAADVAEPGRVARSLSVVVWAVMVGAVAGPILAEPVERAAGAAGLLPATGPFLLSAAVFALAAVVAWGGLRPDPLWVARGHAGPVAGAGPASGPVAAPGPVAAAGPVEPAAPVRPAGPELSGGMAAAPAGESAWRTVWTTPAALLAVTAIAVSHATMVGLMSLTPVHMDHGGASLRLVGLVISLHVAGMYGLSPVFGWAADRFGRLPVLGVGAALLVVSGALSGLAEGDQAGLLSLGLVALGLGWSAALVGGSALLTEAVSAGARTRAQGVSDVAMNVSGAAGGVLAGVIMAFWSYAALALAVAVLAAGLLLRVLVAARLSPAR